MRDLSMWLPPCIEDTSCFILRSRQIKSAELSGIQPSLSSGSSIWNHPGRCSSKSNSVPACSGSLKLSGYPCPSPWRATTSCAVITPHTASALRRNSTATEAAKHSIRAPAITAVTVDSGVRPSQIFTVTQMQAVAKKRHARVNFVRREKS